MNCRKLSVKILGRVLNEGAYSNIVLAKELNEAELSDKDKALLTEIVYGVLRRKKTLDIIISNFVKDLKLMNKDILNILRVAIYQMNFLDKIPSYAACNEAVEEAKEISENDSKLVNGILRNFTKNPDDIEVVGNKIDEYAYKFSFEPWMIRLLIKQYGENVSKKIMSGLNSIPQVSVRVNELKADYDEVFEKLEELEYEVEEGVICPEAICIKGGKSIENNPLFQEGKITVQDESAMIIAPLLELEEGMTVTDLCSAPGGKTTHIAEILQNTGKVLAYDLHESKLGLIKENCERLGITNVEVNTSDATKLNPDLIASSDRILIDVPCSGLGIIRKKPEIKWNKTRNELREIIKVQRDIMECAWMYLKEDGIMIYSTCTLNKEENEENIEWFVSRHKDCSVKKIFIGKQDNLVYNRDGSLTIMPNENMDGFFVTKLEKRQ
ncbi:16S rRNA (cytosine967-C5)-methyltransferase [Clostridium beijerinckii]|uniref:16S rRNA (cytosine(967)-C(5))-methyltransferase RsmB n=1 Tax=Clostridium beijerinckii TaxID=1520 RepID=UPI001493FAEE|nr:16S rRNA (cytosine(967)-C(5))-methyltransferase RsmB [Clostridium beijerinckii]NOW92848.1 16S rRNA (cytosine967-C5)-methyltransferase [Clostridium beijerinckii]